VIVDAFPLAYGPEVLLIRLRELVGMVDRHLVVEASSTFSGHPREPLWPTLADRPEFAPFVGKVEHRVVNFPRGLGRAWDRDDWIRDETLSLVRTVPGVGRGTTVLFGDHDEIPHPAQIRAAVRAWREVDDPDSGPEAWRLFTRYHEWYLDVRAKGSGAYRWEFRQPLLTTLESALHTGGANLRTGQRATPVEGAPWGWHLTLQGGLDAVMDKLRATAHTELQRFSRDEVERRMVGHLDLLDRCPLERVASLDAMPRCVIADPGHFADMLYGDWAQR